MVLTRGLSPAWRLAIVVAAVLVLGAGALIAQQPAPAPRVAPTPRASATPRAATAAAVSTRPRSATTAAAALADEADEDSAAEALLATLAYRRQQRRTAWLGVGLSCSQCSYHTEGKSLSRWVFTESPVLYQVDPGGPADRAGLRTGDTLLTINGRALTTAVGGRAFANMAPGVAVQLGFRRDGRARTARVVPEEPPTRGVDRAEAESLAESLRARQEAAQALTRNYQREAERAQRELTRAQQELERSQKELSDSSRQLIRQYLEQARRSLELSQSPLLAVPAPPAIAALPAPGMAPAFPSAVPPAIAAAPAPDAAAPAPPAAAAAPIAPGHRWLAGSSAALRYSGRLGNTLIEARRPGAVEVIELEDSELVLSGGDLSVRIRLAPGLGPRARTVTVVGGWSVARTTRGALARGIRGYLVNPRLGRAVGSPSGILVLDVAEDSQADSLGIQPGDVLVQLNRDPVVALLPGDAASSRALRGPAPQPTTSATVVREKVRRILQRPAARAPQVPAVPPERRR